MSSIRILAGFAGAIALAIGGPALAQTPKRGGTLNFALSAETPHYDCHGSDTYATLHFASPFYSTLLTFDLPKYPGVKGDLAESWTISQDQKSYTFKLHKNVTFHDGKPLTSADVKATYDRLRNPPTGVVSTRKATFQDIVAIETPDAHTIVFKLKDINPAMMEHFASPWNCVYPAEKITADPQWPKTNILGSGPFKFVEHVKGSHVSGARNDKYFRQGQPYLDGFKGTFFSQSAAMLNALQGGQVLAEFRTISSADRDRLKQAMGDKIRIEESSWTLNLLVVFNTKKKPFDDVRVRRALNMAIDRWGGSQGLARTSALRHVGGLIRPGSPYAIDPKELEQIPGFQRDMAKARAEAKKLLAEAGVPNLKFVLHNRTIAQPYTPAGVFLVDQWRQIGVEVEHRQFETSPYLAGMSSGQFDVAIDFSNLFMDEPSLGLAKYVSSSKAPENRSGLESPEIDALIEKQSHIGDPTERIKVIRQVEKLILDSSHQVPLLWWHRIVATHTKLMGWEMSPSHNLGADLARVWINE
ncbi:MAG: ABC transporter substrate-binding protein [Alphaproteobacteria bacterium]|nr:ABC transporter substrate-binding protein [Alphaproteobacteria bacterium]